MIADLLDHHIQVLEYMIKHNPYNEEQKQTLLDTMIFLAEYRAKLAKQRMDYYHRKRKKQEEAANSNK